MFKDNREKDQKVKGQTNNDELKQMTIFEHVE